MFQTVERVTEKAEIDPARAGITSAADPVEGLEHLLPLAPRNSKAFVFYEDHNAIGPGGERHGGRAAILDGIVHLMEIASRMAVGRQEIVTSRGPVEVIFSPASTASSQMPSTGALRSTIDRTSCFASSRVNDRIDSTMPFIMARQGGEGDSRGHVKPRSPEKPHVNPLIASFGGLSLHACLREDRGRLAVKNEPVRPIVPAGVSTGDGIYDLP
jgi:hypothetical protein